MGVMAQNLWSHRKEGSFLYEIDKHFNPSSEGGIFLKNVFFLEGTRVGQQFYYNYALPRAKIPVILKTHFYDYFDIIGFFGRDDDGETRLAFLRGKELFDRLGQVPRPRKGPQPFKPRQEPGNALMKKKLDQLHQAWLAGKADGIRRREERAEYYQGEPDRAITDFDRKVFRQSEYRAMIILDDYSTWDNKVVLRPGPGGITEGNEDVLTCFDRWCHSEEFLNSGHASFLPFKGVAGERLPKSGDLRRKMA